MHNPFKISCPTRISFSGGRTSAYMSGVRFADNQVDLFDLSEDAIGCYCRN